MLHIVQAKPARPSLKDIFEAIPATHKAEAFRRFPSWELQDSLTEAVSASLLVGVPPLACSPNISHSWESLDPDTWTPAQQEIFDSASTGVLFLHGPAEGQQKALKEVYNSHARGA